MITSLRLRNFKNFKDATLQLGPLSIVIGTNASGKSNLRDAFRFLHGVSRGYTLSEIIGQKWIEGGVLQWNGIRGGTREAAYKNAGVFGLDITWDDKVTYSIDISTGDNGDPPRVIKEKLTKPLTYTNRFLLFDAKYIFDTHPEDDPPSQEDDQKYIFARVPRGGKNKKHGKRLRFIFQQPVLSQMIKHNEAPKNIRALSEMVLDRLGAMRFLDLSPESMKVPSLPGQNILGDRGENLSSVLQAICADENTKHALTNWLKELTPLDVVDFKFVQDQTGKILVSLQESDDQITSAYSASDGTLRFLAMIAALLGPSSAGFYFFEELENGIHPTRLYLLLQLIEQKVREGKIQLLASSHSPQLLGFLSPEAREHTSLIYRLENHADARIKRVVDLPNAKEILESSNLSSLLASGWMENMAEFSEPDEASEEEREK